MYTCMHVCMDAWMHVCVSVCFIMCMRTRMHTRMPKPLSTTCIRVMHACMALRPRRSSSELQGISFACINTSRHARSLVFAADLRLPNLQTLPDPPPHPPITTNAAPPLRAPTNPDAASHAACRDALRTRKGNPPAVSDPTPTRRETSAAGPTPGWAPPWAARRAPAAGRASSGRRAPPAGRFVQQHVIYIYIYIHIIHIYIIHYIICVYIYIYYIRYISTITITITISLLLLLL